MDGVWQDLRFAARALGKQPGFAAVAIVLLALGIGANTAIYTLVDAVALRPLPVTRPSELIRLGNTHACCVTSGLQREFSLFSYPMYRAFRDRTPELATLAAFTPQALSLRFRPAGASAPARPAMGEFVSADYFATLGVPLAAGRGLVAGDDAPGAPPVVVLSYRVWRDDYGLDPSVIGADVTVSTRPLTVVGVTAPQFYGETLRVNPTEIWLPLGVEPLVRGDASLMDRNDQYWLYAIGRFRPGASREAAQDRVSALLREALQADGTLSTAERAQIPSMHVVITSAATGMSSLRQRYADGLRVLAVVSALVLLIACANLANLILARAQPFQFAMKAALGASRRRLVQQTVAGGLLLAGAGGLAGLVVAYAGTRLIVATAFAGVGDLPIDVSPSPTILLFAAAVSLLTGVLSTGLPAWTMAKTNPIEALRGSGRSSADRSALPRQGLVVLQVATSLVLLVGAGLLTTSLNRLQDQPFGFQTSGRLMVKVDPAFAGYTTDRLPALYDRLQADLAGLPGVARVSLSQYSPMENLNWEGPISLEGHPFDPAHRIFSSWLRVGPGYFETVGTRLLQGRTIDERDTAATRHVAVVNEAFVRRFLPAANPIGRHLGLGEEAGHALDYEIVGVVEDAKYYEADAPANPTFFVPLFQTVSYAGGFLGSSQERSLFIHDIEVQATPGTRDVMSLEVPVRRALAAIDPDLTVLDVVSFDDQVGRNFNQQRLIAGLTTLYGYLALLLAGVGLYGLTAHAVARRRGEIGIRMALGADRRQVLGMILRRALAQTAAGILIGLPLALLAARGLASQLYGVSPGDPFVVNMAIAVLAGTAAVAALIPARRAASIDPLNALRE